jgi:transposase-like protein
MGIPGRRIEKDYPPEKIIEMMHEHGGIIKNVAKEMGCALKTLYDQMDLYPEIREAQQLADERLDRHVVETYYETLDTLASMTIEEPSVALNAVKLGLTKSKKSRYYTPPKEKEADASISPAQIAAIAGENAELKKKIEELESKIGK